ncbi:MAG: GNAT family N-acetyltransferase [Wenzhouxiangellaceae bacterium]
MIHSLATSWNSLNRRDNPFSDRRFLNALETAGCVGAKRGWLPRPIQSDASNPAAFAPVWEKHHSHGEFVFDFNWAYAAHNSGMRWYPKLLVAVPLTPVTGPRLLAERHEQRVDLVAQLEDLVEREQYSSCGVNFCDLEDSEALAERGWLARFDWQFHWRNRGWTDFDDFLTALRAKPRKNIRRERRLAQDNGWSYRWVDGETISERELDLVNACYQTTFMLYRNLPVLNRRFFATVAREFSGRFLVCIASRDHQDLACSVFWRNHHRLYGRYWGALEETRDVHFEACYYQGIEYCIRNGLDAFEPGAQGEHKIRRGFEPVRTRSYHYIRHPGLREGIRRWLNLEHEALARHRDDLQTMVPYREAETE